VRTRTLPPPATDERTRLRLTFVAALLLSVFVVLVARLWFVQIVGGDRYQVLAERNRVRAVTLEAPRGRVLDRSGRVLVDNRQVHVIGVAVDEMGDRRSEVLADLARLLGTDVVAIDARIASAPVDPVRPVLVAFDVPERIALFVWEHQATRFPGVHAELVPRRSYPHGRLAAHVLGYTGEITPEQLGDSAYEGVDAGAQVGMAGVERSYDRVLRGAPGTRELEIDAAGDVVRQTSEWLPTPGADPSRRWPPASPGHAGRPMTRAAATAGSRHRRARSWCSTPAMARCGRWRRIRPSSLRRSSAASTPPAMPPCSILRRMRHW
jgi:penicillin-binding protein 2